MGITKSHLKVLTEMHRNPVFCMVISHPGIPNESICDRQMGLNGIMVKYQHLICLTRKRKTAEIIRIV